MGGTDFSTYAFANFIFVAGNIRTRSICKNRKNVFHAKNVVLCCVVLCCVVLCCVMLCCVVLCYAVSVESISGILYALSFLRSPQKFVSCVVKL